MEAQTTMIESVLLEIEYGMVDFDLLENKLKGYCLEMSHDH